MNAVFTNSTQSSWHKEHLTALIIFVFTILIYLFLAPSYPPTFSIIDDSVRFAWQAESPAPNNWFHPHHLFYIAIHRCLWLFLNMLGMAVSALSIMRFTSILSAGLAAALVYLLSHRQNSDQAIAITISAVFTLACGVWSFGVAADTVLPTLAIFLFLIYRLFYQPDRQMPTSLAMIGLGLLYGFGVTLHQMQIIYAPALLVGILGYPRGQRLANMVRFFLAAGIIIAPAYLAVILSGVGTEEPGQAFVFLTQFAHENYWGQGNISSLSESLRAILRTHSFSFQRWGLALFNLPAFLSSVSAVFVLGLGIFGWSRRNPGKDWKLDFGWVITLFVIVIPFVTWWEAGSWDFWVLPWSLVLLGVARLRFKSPKVMLAGCVAVATLVGFYNLTCLVLPNREPNSNALYDVTSRIALLPEDERNQIFISDMHIFFHTRYYGRVEKTILLENDAAWEALRWRIDDVRQGRLKAILLDGQANVEVGRMLSSNPEYASWFESHTRIVVRNRDIMIYELNTDSVQPPAESIAP